MPLPKSQLGQNQEVTVYPLSHLTGYGTPVASLLLVALLTPALPQRAAHMFVLSEVGRKTYAQYSLNFNVTEEHVPTNELYGFLTPVRDLTGNQQSAVTSGQPLEPGALPSTLEQLAKKFRPLIDRVLSRLSEAEQREANVHLRQDIRQAWITASYAQRMSDAFVQASYAIYGKHPDQIWPSIVADRKARLGAEYFDWYGSDDMPRPDLPKIPPRTADSHSANGAGLPGTETGSVPNPERKTV